MDARFQCGTRRFADSTNLSDLALRLALAAVSGAMLGAAFPNVDLTGLAWVGFSPLLIAIKDQSLFRTTMFGWVQGLVFFLFTLCWLTVPLTEFAHRTLLSALRPTLFICAAEAMFPAITWFVASFVSRRSALPMVASLPISWTTFEWIRSFFPLGFPWNLLGYAVFPERALIQFAEVTGIYGVSALVVLVNVAIFDFSLAVLNRRMREAAREAAGVAAVVAGVTVFGILRMYQLASAPPDGELKVAMIQGNIAQSLKWKPEAAPANYQVYEGATRSAAKYHPDLIVWPETAHPYVFQPNAAYPYALQNHLEYHGRLLDLARSVHAPILFGAEGIQIQRPPTVRNRAYLISDRGQLVDYYDKMLLVPFGEYLPIPSVSKHFWQITVQRPFDLDFAAGDQQTIFTVKDAKIAVLICFESIFPNFTRTAVKSGAHVLVNLTNDARYGRSSAPYQIIEMTAMRAVENRVPVIAVGNTGISALITQTGRIVGATELFTPAIALQTARWSRSSSFYSRVGDVFAQSCFALTLVGILMAIVHPKNAALQRT